MSGLTHRRVAQTAGISLSATTYHYETKAEMVAHASRELLARHLQSFRQAASDYQNGKVKDRSLDRFVVRVLANAASTSRQTSLAWCEIMLDAARSAEGHELARNWFADLEGAWIDLARVMDADIRGWKVQITIDTMIGLLFVILPLGLTAEKLEAFCNGAHPVEVWGLRSITANDRTQADRPYSPKAERTRARILDGAIRILNRRGAGAVSYRAVDEESGVALTVPAYYFGSIVELVRVAEAQLFYAAKDRYRQSVATAKPERASMEDLADVTATILIREATEFGLASLAHYSVWLEAARSAALRPEVSAAVLDQAQAWQRRLQGVGPSTLNDGVYFQALFVGQLVRALASGAPLNLLSTLRSEIFAALNHRFAKDR